MAINDRFDNVLTAMRDHEEDFSDALTALVSDYYRNFTDATELESHVVDAMNVLLDAGFNYYTMDAEEIVARAERDINRQGGVLGTNGKRHKVSTFPDYVFDEDED